MGETSVLCWYAAVNADDRARELRARQYCCVGPGTRPLSIPVLSACPVCAIGHCSSLRQWKPFSAASIVSPPKLLRRYISKRTESRSNGYAKSMRKTDRERTRYDRPGHALQRECAHGTAAFIRGSSDQQHPLRCWEAISSGDGLQLHRQRSPLNALRFPPAPVSCGRCPVRT
jgi:hypothetical protein